MKRFGYIAVMFILLANVFGVNASPPLAPNPTTTITIWHNWGHPNVDNISQVLNQYQTDHPGVTISLYQPADMFSELNTAIPSDTGPDLIAWGNDMIGTSVKKNQIIDLDQLGVTPGWLSSTYEPAAIAGVTYAGKIWGLPTWQEGIALVYNKNLVTAAYLPANPLDFNDLRSKAQAFLTATGKPLICNQGFPGGDGYFVAPLFFGFGVPSYVDAYGKVYLNTPEAVNAGTWLAAMPPLSPTAQTYNDCQSALIAGNVGMWWTGPWAIAAISQGGVDYGIVPMGKPFVGIQTLMVTSNAKDRGNAAAALDMMQYLTNTPNSKTLALANKTIPSNSAALNDPDVQAIKTVAGFGLAMNNGVPMSSSPYSGCQWEPVGDAATAIWNGSLTPTAALNAAQAAISQCVFEMQLHFYVPVLFK